MRIPVVLAIAALAFAGARAARSAAQASGSAHLADEPYAPTPGAAPFMSLGFREAAADLLFVRLRGYFGGPENTSDGVAGLCEAIVELNPHFHRPYEYCGGAMTIAKQGVSQRSYLRALALLERGMEAFPSDWRLPNLSAQIYTQDLQTTDPKQRREWDENAAKLVELAVRKPGAPANLADWAAVMRTKFGQRERAITELREVILLTSETAGRKALIKRLAELENQDADEIAGELYVARQRFGEEWLANRPAIPPTWYVLLGPQLEMSFDMTSLATGGHDLVEFEEPEELEPLE